MFKHILVGIDGRDGGRDALALARALATHGTRLTLGHVYGGDPVSAAESSSHHEASERERGLELLGRTITESGVKAELCCTGASSVGRGLHQQAEEAGADLLVVGSTRRGVFGRILIGDDTCDALQGAPCAVAIAPVAYADERHHWLEIGAGYNGSAESWHALAVARRLGEKLGAVRVSAMETIVAHPAGLLTLPPSSAAIDERIAQATERIRAHGVEPHAVYGRPSEELAVYSTSLDLLVVGSREYGPLGRMLYGSTTRDLMRTARCPLLSLTRATRSDGWDDEHRAIAVVRDAG
jgi:nucleotide-binding universal stress UspA family protein